MSCRFRSFAILFALATAGTAIYLGTRAQAAEKTTKQASSEEKQAQREKRLSESLSGATMVGHFTITGEEQQLRPKVERYELKQVRKLPNGRWLFQARILYGDHDVVVPLALPIEWAGDTPVIIVDDVPVPTLGTFRARVMIYADHYAGFWEGAGHGGHMFGMIERPEKAGAKDDK